MAITVIRRGEIHNRDEFERFGCKVTKANPDTPDRVTPDVEFIREFTTIDMAMPDGARVEVWSFFDPATGPLFPNEIIRVREGQTYHTTLKSSLNTHTIHHHGVEPTPFNDGVGHTSFEVSGHYTYQERASHAGSFFYHCHKNTVLHFEMGLYGLLIVDPPTGEGTVYRINDIIPYDIEAFWAADEIDPTWRKLNHDAGMECPNGEDAGLNSFNPRYFLITGVPHPHTRTDPRVAVNAQVGQTVLIRITNAGYTVQRFTIRGLNAEVISVDGRALGQSPHSPYSRPFIVPAGTPFELTTAQRWDLLIKPASPGTYPVKVEFLQWVRRDVLGIAETFINVA